MVKSDTFVMRANYTTTCACRALVYVGTWIKWDHTQKRVVACQACAPRKLKQLELNL